MMFAQTTVELPKYGASNREAAISIASVPAPARKTTGSSRRAGVTPDGIPQCLEVFDVARPARAERQQPDAREDGEKSQPYDDAGGNGKRSSERQMGEEDEQHQRRHSKLPEPEPQGGAVVRSQ